MMLRFVLFILILNINFCFFSQATSSLSRKSFLIGEEVKINLELKYFLKDGQIQYIPWSETIPISKVNWKVENEKSKSYFLELLTPFKDTIIKIDKNTLHWLGEYKVTMWDSGHFVIPKHDISLQNKIYEFPEMSFSVSFPDLKKKNDFYDIKENFGNISSSNSFLWYFFIIGIIILILVVIIFFIKRNRKKINKINNEVTFNEYILNQLNELFKKELWKKIDTQHIHYMHFTNLIKLYLSEKYSLSLVDRTSAEIILLLKQKNVDDKEITELNNLMNQMDLIKFAQTTIETNLVLKHKDYFINMIKNNG